MNAGSAKRPWRTVALLAAGVFSLALYLFYAQRATGNFGFPLDDSWIHLQIARNLASGQGWSYNPGEPTGASTSPLWVLVIAPLFWLPGDVTIWVKALGAALFLANILLVADSAQRVTRDARAAWLAGLLVAWGPTHAWGALSGMEVGLYLLLVLLGLRAALVAGEGRGRGYAATAWLALAGWARPETWALLPVVWGYWGWRGRAARCESEAEHPERSGRAVPAAQSKHVLNEVEEGRSDHPARPHPSTGHHSLSTLIRTPAQDACRFTAAFRAWAPHLLIAAAVIAAFLAFNLLIWGRPLPGTWYAKTAFGQGSDPTGAIAWALHFGSQLMSSIQAAVYSQNPFLVVTLALGGVALGRAGRPQRRGLALLLAVVAATCVAAAAADLGSAGLQNYRRAGHLVAALNILAAAGAVALWDLLPHPRPLSSQERGAFSPSLAGRGSGGGFLFAPRPGPKGGFQFQEVPRGPGGGFRLGPRPPWRWLLAAAVLAMQLAGLRQGALFYADNIRSINQGDVAAGRWIAAHTPADAAVAANDIGAIAYFGGRRIVDLVGLASPEVVEVTATSRPRSVERERRLRDLLLAQGADYVVIFPEWFPHLSRDPALVEVARFTVPAATALAHDNVVVYRLVAP